MKLQIVAMFLKTYVFVDHGTLYLFCVVVYLMCLSKSDNVLFFFLLFKEQIEMIYKIIAHMAANDRALIAEGSCRSPRSVEVFLGECNIDELYA